MQIKDKIPILLQINVVANSGSTGHIAEEIGKLAIASGWKSYIAYGRWACPSQSKLIRIGDKFDLLFHFIKSYLFDCHGLGSTRATRKLINDIEEIAPDIIQLHNIHGYYLNYKVLFKYLSSKNTPVVWTLHDCWGLTGHCVHFQDIKCMKWQNQCVNCPNITGYPKSLFWDNSARNYFIKKTFFNKINNLTIITVCSWLDDIVNRSFLKQNKRQIIVNGINLDIFSPLEDRKKIKEALGIQSQFMILAVATVWNKAKGWNDILRMSELINSDCTIVIVGLTSKQLKLLPKRVVGITHTENILELAKLYSAADIFVNPTYQDTLPTVNIEALASGTPIATYNTGGSADVVDDKTGFIVRPGDLDALVQAINVVKEKGKDFYKEACRNRAVKLFNKDDRYKDYFSLYNRLLQI